MRCGHKVSCPMTIYFNCHLQVLVPGFEQSSIGSMFPMLSKDPLKGRQTVWTTLPSPQASFP